MSFTLIVIILVLGFFGFVIMSIIAMQPPTQRQCERHAAAREKERRKIVAANQHLIRGPTEEQFIEQAARALRIQRAGSST
jgi:Flp pilus assembly protein CpaB